MQLISRLEQNSRLDGVVSAGQRAARLIRPGKVRDALHGVCTFFRQRRLRPPGHADATQPEPTEADRIMFLRPSRYVESDRLAAVVRIEFAGISTGQELLAAVSSWVGAQLTYSRAAAGPPIKHQRIGPGKQPTY